ncbi:MAG: replicative DNA helicase [Pseudomonadota bacterium]
MTDRLRQVPHSIEAERAVLGGLLIDPERFDEIMGLLVAEDFYMANHRLIFRAISELSSQSTPLDIVTLAQQLESVGHLDDVGGLEYLLTLHDSTPTAANLVAYARIVANKHTLRRLVMVGAQVMALAMDAGEKPISDVINEAENQVYEVSAERTMRAELQSITSILPASLTLLDEIQRRQGGYAGLPSGYTDLDNITNGFGKASLIILAARPSMGKTSLAMNMAEYVALEEAKPALVFSMEMSATDIALRLLASVGRLDQGIIRAGQLKDVDWVKITTAITKLDGAPLYIDDSAKLTPNQIRSNLRRFVHATGALPGIVIIDYLQLMDADKEHQSRVGELTEITRSLKQIAKEFDCPVLALSQLNRQSEHRVNRRPMASDLRESGSIEQDADLILAIYRDEVYNDQAPRGDAELIILKHRNGPIGTIKLTFLHELTRFENAAHPSQQF